MPLQDIVDLQITQDSASPTRAGFGVPLILSVNAGFAERIRFYSGLNEVLTDFPATTGPEYLAAAAIFSQRPRPPRIAIGRALGQPTKSFTLNVVTVRDNHTYQLSVKGEGVTAEVVEYTSDGTALDAEIAAGLVSALNLVTGKNFTASGASSPFTVTGDAAGDWFSVEVLDPTDLSIQEDHAEPATTLATDLAAIQVESDDWYALITLYNSVAYVAAAAAWIETQKKIYITDVNDTDAITVAEASGTDVLDDIDEANYARTGGFWHPDPSAMAAARWVGSALTFDPGSETWAHRTLRGLTAPTLTSTHRTNLEDRNASYYRSEADTSFTWEGNVGDGDFIDVTRFIDWLEDDMKKSVFGAINSITNSAGKLPYTEAGVAVIENEVRGSLQRGVNRGGLRADPEPQVQVPKVEDVDETDRGNRLLPDITFDGQLAGAIHKTQIRGTVSV